MTRPNYISLTTAIEMFEEYRAEKAQNFSCKGDNITPFTEMGSILYYDFLYFIVSQKLSLYGLNNKTKIFEPVPERLVSQILWDDDNKDLRSSCYIRNTYDYKNTYNPSTNYDALYNYNNTEPLYTNLCVLYQDLVDLVKEIAFKVSPQEKFDKEMEEVEIARPNELARENFPEYFKNTDQ